MELRNIFITEPDMERLRYVLDLTGTSGSKDQESLHMLERELDRAQVVASAEIPKDVVTMNSRIRVKDLDTGNETTYTLVFPQDSNFAQGKMSILAPIGTAILGYRVGDAIEWDVPRGRRRLQVKELLYQPEAADRAVEVASHRTNEGGEWAIAAG